MEQQSIQQLITQYLDLIRRGKYFIIVPLAICVFLGTAVAFKLPKVYRSETKMFYMQTQLPDWAKLEVINMYLEAMLVFIEALAISPENCKKLITELELYPEKEGKVASSSLIGKFQNGFTLSYDYTEVPTATGRTQEIITGFTFSFDHADPRKAYYVANALATDFIGLFRQFREVSSSRGESFFEAERERLRREMSLIDQQISDFKQKHVNELPELFQFNYSALERLNQKIFFIDQQLMEMRDRKQSLEAQLNTLDPLLGMTGISGERIITPQERLAALTAELGQLRARYSDRHPDVRRTQQEIEELKKIVPTNDGQNGQNDGFGGAEGRKTIERNVRKQSAGAFNPAYSQFLVQLDEVKSEIASLQTVRAESQEEIEEYQRRVGMTPLVEKEWLILARDRDSAEKRFNDLASQVQTMQSAAEMEKRELGGRLTIGQPPVIPGRPYKPNIPLIIGGSFILGLSIGVGLLLGFDYMYKIVRGPQDIAIPGLAVIVDLPMIVSADVAPRVRINKVFVRVAVLILLIGVIVAVDLFYMKIDVLIFSIITMIKTKFILTGL